MKLTPESIHVVVLGFASAVIVDEDIREELEYVPVRSLSTCSFLPMNLVCALGGNISFFYSPSIYIVDAFN